MFMDVQTFGIYLLFLIVVSGLISYWIVKAINTNIWNMPKWLDNTVFIVLWLVTVGLFFFLAFGG